MGRKKLVEVSAVELRKLRAKVAAEDKRKAKKAAKKFDGLGPHLKQKIRSAIREVWQRSSESRKIVVARTALPNGYAKCEHPACKGKRYPKNYIDHIVNVGDLDGGFIERMFVPSKGLQGLCKKHHDEKTKLERSSKNKTVKTSKSDIDDFY